MDLIDLKVFHKTMHMIVRQTFNAAKKMCYRNYPKISHNYKIRIKNSNIQSKNEINNCLPFYVIAGIGTITLILLTLSLGNICTVFNLPTCIGLFS